MINWYIDEVNIFPNPFNNSLTISLYSKYKISWEISDVRGKL